MQVLTEYKAEEFLEKNHFNIVERKLFNNLSSALVYAGQIGFPVVLKLCSDHLAHKSDVNGVRLNVYRENFEKEFRALQKMKIKKDGIVVQKQLQGKYVLIGLKKDQTFGHVLVVGIGGIFAEIIKDVSYKVTPVNKKQAKEMLSELKGYKVLTGYRGERINIKEVIKAIINVSKLSKKYGNIEELDINPLVVNSREALIVDARIVFN